MGPLLIIFLWLILAGGASYIEVLNRRKKNSLPPVFDSNQKADTSSRKGLSFEELIESFDKDESVSTANDAQIETTKDPVNFQSLDNKQVALSARSSLNLRKPRGKERRRILDVTQTVEEDAIRTSYTIDGVSDLKRAFVWSEILNRRF